MSREKNRTTKTDLRRLIRCELLVRQELFFYSLPDCPDPGVFGSLIIPLAASCCFMTGVPLGKGSIGTMKLRGSTNCVASSLDSSIRLEVANGLSTIDGLEDLDVSSGLGVEWVAVDRSETSWALVRQLTIKETDPHTYRLIRPSQPESSFS